MLIDDPSQAPEDKILRSGAALPKGASAPEDYLSLALSDHQWYGQSIFPYPPARSSLAITLISAPFFFVFWTCFLAGVVAPLEGAIWEHCAPYMPKVVHSALMWIILSMDVFVWIYVPVLWITNRGFELFNWKIEIGRDALSFPDRVTPNSWQSNRLSVKDTAKVALFDDTSRRVSYKIDEDRRYAQILVFKHVIHEVEDVRIELDELSKADRDQFLLALGRLFPPDKLSLQLQDEIKSLEADISHRIFDATTVARKQLSASVPTSEGRNFTEWWQRDFQRRLSATNYVPLSMGQTLQEGRFVIDAYMASGGQSTTYLAHKFDGTAAVVKESVVPELVDESIRQKVHELFSREARLLVKCNHPRIALIQDHFAENGRDYLVMDYIPGMTLGELVRQNGPQSESQVVKWAESVTELFVYLHSLEPPILHRDVSPDNLILGESDQIFLIDFGAANDTIGDATGTVIGKQSYIAPEQFRGKAVPASDIYAFGGTLHFLLSGKDPLPLSVCHPKEENEQISQEIDDLIAACTSQEPELRPDVQAISKTLRDRMASEFTLLEAGPRPDG
jgi:tRNA A-37 threonylcarbamoyl transferase component Bud32